MWFNFLKLVYYHPSSFWFLWSSNHYSEMAQQLWKSFMEALAPPRRDQQPRRGGVTLNCTVGGRPLPQWEANSQAVGRGSGALSGNREVMRANLNEPQPSLPSARVVEVDSSSDDEFQDSNTQPVPRSLAESITATRVPQVTTQQTSQPPSPTRTRHQVQRTESVVCSDSGFGRICGKCEYTYS